MPEHRSIRGAGPKARKPPERAGRPAHDPAATLRSAQESVGAFLRATRERMGLTQAEVAARTRESAWKLSRAAVSAIERGQNFPGLEAMLALSNVLQIDPKELIERARLTAVVPVDVTGLDDRELESRASQYFWAGNYTQALSVYDALVQKLALEEHDEPDRLAERLATVEVRRATTLKRAGALISAIASAERAIVLASRMPSIQAEAYVVLADLQVQRGHLPLARDAAERAIALAAEVGSAQTVAWGWLVSGRIHFLAGRHAEAREAFLEARRGIAAAGDSRHRTHIEGNIGMCHVACGELDDAREWIERAATFAHESRQPALEASWRVELGKIALAQGRLEDAERLADKALELARPRGHALTVFRAEWLRHRILTERDPDAGDARRLELLTELYPRLDQHEGIDEIREYKRSILTADGPRGNE